MATQAQWRARLRSALGLSKATAKVADDDLDLWLDEALREVNRHWPSVVLGSFETVAGTQSYSPLPAGGRDIVEVYYDTGGINVDLGPHGETDEAGVVRYVEPFFELAKARLDEWRLGAFGSMATVAGAVIYLDPTPTSVVTVYFTYHGKRFAALEDVDELHDRQLMTYAEWRGNGALALGQNAVESVQSATGIGARTAAPGNHKAAAEAAWKRWLDGLPMLPPVIRARP